MRKMLFTIFACVLVVPLYSGLSMGQSSQSFIEKGTVMGIQYASGGVGLEERTLLDDMAKDYNLKLVFALTSGPYLSNIMVVIRDNDGKTLVEKQSNGPWFFAMLPKGKYSVSAAHGNQKKDRTVELGTSRQTVMLHWKG